ncbi:uncharacterized protein DS421_18g621520 [Arachis hypogaea]|nr:uncharacterized protein DS421_18g621520 [Arachis hypogaea]
MNLQVDLTGSHTLGFTSCWDPIVLVFMPIFHHWANSPPGTKETIGLWQETSYS